MANAGLTPLIPTLYEALDIISREQVGFIPSVSMDSNTARAAVGQSVSIPIAPASASENIVPGVTPPDTGDQTFSKRQMTITKAKAVPFRWTGEEQRGVNSGPGYANLRRDQIVQAMRTLTNEVEVDVAATYKRASRAYGTPGTTPFATNLGDPAQVLKILKDNGAPPSDLQLVIDTAAGANMRTLAQLTKANEAATDELLRQGILLNIHGFNIRESAAVSLVTKGTGTGYLVNNSGGYAAGATAITVDTGTGTILAGDVVTFAGDTNKYVVDVALTGGVVTLQSPGLRAAVADNVAVSVVNSYTSNLAFHRNAITLATRLPALPEEGDSAIDRQTITDPRSGLSMEVAIYPLYRSVRYEVAMAWGVDNIKPEHTVLLLG